MEQSQSECRCTKLSGYVNAISRQGSTPAERLVVSDFANCYHIGHYNLRFRQGRITANERNTERASQRPEAIIESSDPGPAYRPREGKRNQREAGPRAHRRQITQSARQCAMTYGLRRVEVKPKVYALERKISGENQVAAARGSHNRSIVADPEADTRSAVRPAPTEPLNELGFIAKGRVLLALAGPGAPLHRLLHSP
jgi:hypothetical protein